MERTSAEYTINWSEFFIIFFINYNLIKENERTDHKREGLKFSTLKSLINILDCKKKMKNRNSFWKEIQQK